MRILGSLGIVGFLLENSHFPARCFPGGARTANSTPEWPDLASEASKTRKSKRICPASAPGWCPAGPGIDVFLAGIAHFPAWGLPGGARTATCTPEWPDLAPEMPKPANMRPDLPCIHSGMVPCTSRLPRFLAWNGHVANPVPCSMCWTSPGRGLAILMSVSPFWHLRRSPCEGNVQSP